MTLPFSPEAHDSGPAVLQEAARALGLRRGEALALLLFHDAGTMALRELRRLLPIGPSQVSRLVNALEDRGAVERVVPAEDRRLVMLELTEIGWELREGLERGLPSADLRRRACEAELELWRGLRELQTRRGISEAQARCLLALRDASAAEGGMTAADTAAAAGVKRTTAAMALARLVELGLAEAMPGAFPARYRARTEMLAI